MFAFHPIQAKSVWRIEQGDLVRRQCSEWRIVAWVLQTLEPNDCSANKRWLLLVHYKQPELAAGCRRPDTLWLSTAVGPSGFRVESLSLANSVARDKETLRC